MSTQKGQAFLEAIYALQIALGFTGLILSFSYSIYAKEISSYYLYRALLCTEELGTNNTECLATLKKNINNSLFFHKNISFNRNFNSQNKFITLNAKFLTFNTKYSKSLKVARP